LTRRVDEGEGIVADNAAEDCISTERRRVSEGRN